MSQSKSLASKLLNKRIDKWNVIEKRSKTKEDNSGAFSSCYYVVDDDGNHAFLKALNFQYAFNAIGPSVDAMKMMVDSFTYESDLLEFCKACRMNRIVTAIDSGEYNEDGWMPVPYLVFETASKSLKNVELLTEKSIISGLIIFHGVLLGVSQLHWNKITHQDIKPSNILIFGEDYSKIADLGSAVRHDGYQIPDGKGPDLRHAPIELLYRYLSSDLKTRCYGGDLFMLGGLLSFIVSGTNMLSLMMKRLPPDLRWLYYQGAYIDILPSIMTAFHEAHQEVSITMPDRIRDDLSEVLFELSYPIPEKRGNPRKPGRSLSQYSLTRYISIVDRLSKMMVYEFK